MELDKPKYCWFRPPALFFLAMVAVLGMGMLYLYFFNMEFVVKLFGTMDERVTFTEIFFLVLGGFFTLFGIGFGIDHYRNGITYVQKGKVPFNELDRFIEYDNGLLVVLKNWARVLTYPHTNRKILARGYIKLLNEYDHNKKLKNWTLMVN